MSGKPLEAIIRSMLVTGECCLKAKPTIGVRHRETPSTRCVGSRTQQWLLSNLTFGSYNCLEADAVKVRKCQELDRTFLSSHLAAKYVFSHGHAISNRH